MKNFKKVIIIACGIIQAAIIGVAELATCALLMNWVADRIDYHGLWNLPLAILIVVGVLATFVVWFTYMERCVRNG